LQQLQWTIMARILLSWVDLWIRSKKSENSLLYYDRYYIMQKPYMSSRLLLLPAIKFLSLEGNAHRIVHNESRIQM